MEFTVTSMHMGILEDGAKERRKLTRVVRDAIRAALAPIDLNGLRSLDTTWVYPPLDEAPEPGVIDMRYYKKKEELSCRFIMSPEVASNTPEWTSYRVIYVEQAASMMEELFAGAERRLKKNGYEGDIDEARKAVSVALAASGKEYRE